MKTHVFTINGRKGYGKTEAAARVNAILNDRERNIHAERERLIARARMNKDAFTKRESA